MKKVMEDVGRFYHHYPRLVVVVTSCSGEKEDAMAVTWHSPVSSHPPLFGVSVSPRRFSYKLILESKEFGVNFLPLEKAELAVATGAVRGEEVDKFKTFHIERNRGTKTSVPIFKDAYAAYECRLVDSHVYGDHEWLVGEVVALHLLPQVITPQQTLDMEKLSPLLYLGSDTYITTDSHSQRSIDRQPFRQR